MTRVIGVDIGGTFTDVVVSDAGRVDGFKVPSTPSEPSLAVATAVDWRDDDLFLHGTTVATNALIEEAGATVALVTDIGFEDLVEIARQDRPSLYDSAVDRPASLVPRALRVGHGGDLDDTAASLSRLGPDVAVVGLVDTYLDPAAEDGLAAGLATRTGIPVLAATSISPEFREYERIATAALSAYLTPTVAGYLQRLTAILPVSRSLVMTSAGGLVVFEEGSGQSVRLVLSGPAGGVVAAAAVGAHHGHHTVISFDMGGTSTDVCRIAGGAPEAGPGHTVAGRVARVPSLPVRTIGAGGGSVGWVDQGGALRVGPRSAGADPGPASYGLGGTEPTITDANLVAGHIPADLDLAGRLRLDTALARAAMAILGAKVGLDPLACAHGMLDVVDSHMEHALRKVSVEEGTDPREAVLVAFGGAGGLHAGRLARSLGIPKVLVPPLSGVFSAAGLLLSAPRADAARTVMLRQGDPGLGPDTSAVAAHATRRFGEVFAGPPERVVASFDCRYVGQSHEVEVLASPDWADVRTAFEGAHHRQFGFARPGEPFEVVNLRVVATGRPPLTWKDLVPTPPRGDPFGRDGVWERRSLPAGFRLQGPATVVEESSAVRLEPGQNLAVLDDGTLEMTEA